MLPETDTPIDHSEFAARTRPGRWGCIEWAGARSRGYGLIHRNGHEFRAHRVAWKLAYGALSDELTIDHLCCNKGCVNVEHMEAVTDRENSRRILHPPAGWVEVGPPARRGVLRRRVLHLDKSLYTPSGRARKADHG